MSVTVSASRSGFDALRLAILEVLAAEPLLATTASTTGSSPGGGPEYPPDAESDAQAGQLAALVDLARGGDAEAFGMLYDHYSTGVYRFIYYRVSAQALAEDLTSETFFRALRSMTSFQWQGKDFGAWLITIARNLIVDHYKAGRTRLEMTTDDFASHEGATAGPEDEVLTGLTNEILREALTKLPAEQQECLVLRFLNSSSIAETAEALGRSEGAIKQLQLRAIRNLAKILPEGLR